MHCVWCDTPASIGDTTRNYTEIELKDLVEQIQGLSEGCHSVSLTGGEPLLQAEFIKELIPHLKNMGLRVYLESNGICPQELAGVIDGVDMIAMDIKLPSSTKEKAYWAEHEEFLRVARRKDVFIKAVISADTAKEDIIKAVDIVKNIDPGILFIIQPNTYELRNGLMDKCQDFQSYCLKHLPDVRILPQTHKFLKVR
jgi:7-carboxy-7-deazaguanine synthase